jgi:hypothetical protein
MIVVLDDTLEVNPRALEPKSLELSKDRTVRALIAKAKEKGYKGPVDVTLEDASISGRTMFHTIGFVGMLSQAYSAHLPVVVAPHDFWFIANTELAAMVAKNPDQFRHVFTAQESGKETLIVPTGDVTRIDYRALTDLLDERIPNARIKELMIPGLTTIDASVFYALCATLADTCQHYYDYMTMMCGIPKIKVRGEESDYRLLAAASRELAEILSFSTEAVTYYDRIAGLFDRMADTFVLGPEESAEFWRSIYTETNVGSGRQLDIDGWIRDFFTKRPRRLESFHTSIAAVPYKNLETQNEYLSLVGAFTAFEDSEGFWRLNFQEAVFQKVAEKDAPPEVKYVSTTRTERTTHYSDGTKKVEKFDKSPNVGTIRMPVAVKTGRRVSPNVGTFQPPEFTYVQHKIPAHADDDLGTAYAFAVAQLMKEEDRAKNPELPKAGVIRGVRWVAGEDGIPMLEKKKEEKK